MFLATLAFFSAAVVFLGLGMNWFVAGAVACLCLGQIFMFVQMTKNQNKIYKKIA
jgi:hypothetical protein